jgi:hypothetical protein
MRIFLFHCWVAISPCQTHSLSALSILWAAPLLCWCLICYAEGTADLAHCPFPLNTSLLKNCLSWYILGEQLLGSVLYYWENEKGVSSGLKPNSRSNSNQLCNFEQVAFYFCVLLKAWDQGVANHQDLLRDWMSLGLNKLVIIYRRFTLSSCFQ